MKTVVRTMKPNTTVNHKGNVLQVWHNKEPVAELVFPDKVILDPIHKGKELPRFILLDDTRVQTSYFEEDDLPELK